MLHEQRFIEAVRASGVARVAVVDDAFDPPVVDLKNAGPLIEFFEDPQANAVLGPLGVAPQEIAEAIAAINESDWESEVLTGIISTAYRRYVESLDPALDIGGLFSAEKGANLTYVTPILALLRKCEPPLEVLSLGAMDDAAPEIADKIDLIFLDFYLSATVPVDAPGTAADRKGARSQSLAKIKSLIEKLANRAPSVVLMSSHEDVATQAEKFRGEIEGGAVYASRFTFLLKKHVTVKDGSVVIEDAAADALLDIVQTFQFGRHLNDALEGWLASAADAVKLIRNDIGSLQLKDLAYLVKFRLADEGQALPSYLEWFFGECLLGGIGEGVTKKWTAEALAGLNKAAVEKIEGAFDGPTKMVAELYHRARIIDPREGQDQYRMGDMYLVGQGNKRRVKVILTPDCDLMQRPDGSRPKQLLLVGGSLRSFDVADVVVSDFVLVDGKAYNLVFDPKDVTSVDVATWPAPGASADEIRFLGGLRPLYAQAMQRAVLNDLGRVGVSVPPAIAMSGAATVSIRNKAGKVFELAVEGAGKAPAYIVPGRGQSDPRKVVFVRRFVAGLIRAFADLDVSTLAKLDPAVEKHIANLKKPESADVLQKMFQGGVEFDEADQFGIVVMHGKDKPRGDVWCWINVLVSDA